MFYLMAEGGKAIANLYVRVQLGGKRVQLGGKRLCTDWPNGPFNFWTKHLLGFISPPSLTTERASKAWNFFFFFGFWFFFTQHYKLSKQET